MKFKIISMVLLNVTLHSNISNAKEMKGENLIQKLPIPAIGGPWKAYSKVESDGKKAMWRNKGGFEILQTFVSYRRSANHSVEGIKLAGENSYKKSCSKFYSETISKSTANGYKSITWKIVCKVNSNFTVTVLHKGITGNDAIYLVQKIWKLKVSKKSEAIWYRYLDQIYVCDSRLKKSPCSASFR